MNTLSKNKGTILGGIIIVLAAVAYNMFFATGAIPPVPSELEAAGIGEDLRRMHSELQSVTLDRTLFTSQEFLYLEDYSLEVPAQPTGRTNPFDVIGRD